MGWAHRNEWDVRWVAPLLALQLVAAVDPPATATRAVAQAIERVGGSFDESGGDATVGCLRGDAWRARAFLVRMGRPTRRWIRLRSNRYIYRGSGR